MDKVEEYIKKLKSPQKEIVLKLRKILLKTLKCDEEYAWGVLGYDKRKFYLAGLKDSVNFGFSVKGLDKKEISNFKGAGKYMRHLKFRSLDEINEKELIKLIKIVDKKSKCVCC